MRCNDRDRADSAASPAPSTGRRSRNVKSLSNIDTVTANDSSLRRRSRRSVDLDTSPIALVPVQHKATRSLDDAPVVRVTSLRRPKLSTAQEVEEPASPPSSVNSSEVMEDAVEVLSEAAHSPPVSRSSTPLSMRPLPRPPSIQIHVDAPGRSASDMDIVTSDDSSLQSIALRNAQRASVLSTGSNRSSSGASFTSAGFRNMLVRAGAAIAQG